jgi:NADH-ubiquinone oxidoreductase chain 5
LAFFHLLTYALLRVLLLICAGVIIHTIKDSQDIRFIGNLSIQIPFTSVCISVSSFALCGIPFLAGFYSKDLILKMVSIKAAATVHNSSTRKTLETLHSIFRR